MTSIDLDAYFARIHYSGSRSPTYETLAAVLRGHTANIPFESFDVLLGRPVRLDAESLQAKIIAARRGGYCFEHASLMYAALEAIGFAPVRHSSRVLLFEPRNESARQHMFLTVATGGASYVIDPGFGPFACAQPIPIDGNPVPSDAPTHRLVRDGSDWFLCVMHEGQEVQGWVSKLEEEYPVDFEMMNHYIATHPASFFTHNILASAATPEGRVNIMNQGVNVVHNGVAEATQLPDRKALRSLVARHFGFDLPELETMRVDSVPDWQ
ncbi:arylamine N-acetyltransferase [Bradyrhizobium sp. INPA01-394B]|uniref:Arylamine N-acetyltransferase n=1 Tax=Bradyrhizobium campsiandrae TaxID=1729892 RepID=A0ABR7UG69_9BRAD|nr:arylamine N-acetyltransferase [Bradyrhizobium campsiandrae]MBC9879076.1 arylamine N-acetyltransferase [Bradyrhizobium campsiandrae]MBC9982984.1 arylamine N-acetyltransferase [Bradyrhizobium campsiandrae]